MDLLTEPVTAQPKRAVEPLSSTDWMESLATGACDQETFLHGVGELLQRAPDAGWELLALIDQYYRRGKIDADTFASLKGHLQNSLMGKGDDISVPLRHVRPEIPAVAASPPPTIGPTIKPAGAPAANPKPVASMKPQAAASARPVARPVAPPPRAQLKAPPPLPITRPATADVFVESEPSDVQGERSLAVGDVLRDRYRVVSMLGQGGMGTVFAAIDQYRLDRAQGDQKVAVKVLHTAVIQRPRLFAELRREFQHLQSLSHPNIVRVHEFDRDGDLAFFTMEYLSGVLLTRVLTAQVSSSLHRPYAFSIIRDVGAAVSHAHARGVVHGDLNPGNIFITDGGDIRVLDFGAAHPLRRTPWISEFEASNQITVATPSYASCQLLEGETADARDDVYALACIAYVLLTGNHPFGEHSSLKARTLRLKPARPPDLGGRQWQALRAGLHFERDRRPTDVAAWLRELESSVAASHLPELPTLLTLRPARRRDPGWIIAVLVVALVGAGAWWAANHTDALLAGKTVAMAKIRAAFANTVLSQLWDNGHDGRRRSRTADVVPASPVTPASQAPREPTAAGLGQKRTAAAPPATEGMDPAPIHSNPAPTLTRNGPRPLADAAAPVVPAAGGPIHARIELAADNIDVVPGESVAHVVVRRTRTLRGDVSFNWWTESGTAKPGRDFSPVKAEERHIEDGRNAADLEIPIMTDPVRHDPRSFYIVIDGASDNAALGQRTLTMVTIPGTE